MKEMMVVQVDGGILRRDIEIEKRFFFLFSFFLLTFFSFFLFFLSFLSGNFQLSDSWKDLIGLNLN